MMRTSIFRHGYRPPTGSVALMLLLALGLGLALLLLVPRLLQIPSVNQALFRHLETRTGQRIAVNQMDLRLFPRPRLHLEEVRVYDPASQAAWLSAERVEATVLFWPLVRGRLESDHLIIDRPRLTARHSQWAHWRINESRTEATRATTNAPFNLLGLARNLLIVDGTATIVDEAAVPGAAPMQIASLQAIVTEDIPGRSARFQLSGEVPQRGASARLGIEGSVVTGAVPAGIEETAAAVPQVHVQGNVRIHQANIPYLAGMLGMPALSAFPAAPAQFMARIQVLSRDAGYDVLATEWKVGIADLSLHGDASLIGLNTPVRRLSATMSASSMPIMLLLDQLAVEWLPSGFRDRLTEHAVDGLVTVYDTHLEGLLGEKPRFTVTGGIDVRNGRFSLGASHPVVRDLAATITYDLEQIRFTAFRANYGPVHLSDGTALITDWRAEPTADVRISAEARAMDVIALVNDGKAFPQLEKVLAQLEQVSGDVLMSAHLSGRPGKGEMGLVETAVAIRNLGFRHQAVTMPFRRFEANLRLSPAEILLDRLQGQAGPVMIEATGRVDLVGKPFFDGLLLNAVIEGQDLTSYIHGMGNGAINSRLAGPIVLKGTISGNAETPQFKGALTLDGTALEIPTLFTKAAGSPAGLLFDGELTADRVLSIRRAELVSPPVRLTGEGHIRLHDAMDFEARLISAALSLERFPPGVRLGPIRAGILQAGLKVRGQAADRASWRASGRLRFDEGVLNIEQLPHSIKDLSVGLRFDGKSIDIRRLTFTLGESDVRVSGTITDWMDAPRAKLLVESSQIDAQTLEVKGQAGSSDSDTFSILSSWTADGSVEATLLIDHVYYERFLLTGFSCRVRMERGLVTIDRISADTNDGHLGGRVVLDMPDRGHATARSTFRASGIPVERVLSLLGGGPRMTGWMSATGRMQAEFERKRLLRASINSRRPISLIIEDGRIFHVPVLAKLLAIMNLPALLKGKIDLTKAGMPVDRLKAVFSVEDGIIKIREFLLDSPILKISGTGRYDYIEDQFDAVLVTSPLGQYSALLKSIPLFGKLFAGERQGFDTAIFEVKGSAKDPNVVYLPAESLMAGVKGTAQLAVDLLVNAITLPKEAFSMAEDLYGEDDES